MQDEVTVGIPVFNGSATIRGVLDRLTLQEFPNLKVFVYDNGSTDGTQGLMSELVARGFYGKKEQYKTSLDITFFPGLHDDKLIPYQNALVTRQKIAKLVNTEFIFFLDSDVIIQPYAMKQLLKQLKDNPSLGYVAIRYQSDAHENHLMLGATMWRTEVFKRISFWDGKVGCDCQHCRKEVEAMGLKGEFNKDLQAYHCNYHMINF